jgi:hypothetical protein
LTGRNVRQTSDAAAWVRVAFGRSGKAQVRMSVGFAWALQTVWREEATLSVKRESGKYSVGESSDNVQPAKETPSS